MRMFQGTMKGDLNMNTKLTRFFAWLLLVCLMVGGASAEQMAVPADAAGAQMVVPEGAAGEQMVVPGGEGNGMPAIGGMFRPADFGFQSQEEYSYPFMGMQFNLPKKLTDKMDEAKATMLPFEEWTSDNSDIRYAMFAWSHMTPEQSKAEVDKMGTGFEDWEKSLVRGIVLGMYQKDMEGELDKLTRCTDHQKIGESADGAYVYYLSTNPGADAEMAELAKEIKATVTPRAPFENMSAFNQPVASSKEKGDNVGTFSTTDINGNPVTEEMFKKNKLTFVNVLGTFCTACIMELPDLEKLSKEMADKGVGFAGIVVDTLDTQGKPDQEYIEKAKVLAEKTGTTFPMLVPSPDANWLNGKLTGIQSFPYSFFVDQDGNIVGEGISGSKSYEEWKTLMEKTLESLQEKK